MGAGARSGNGARCQSTRLYVTSLYQVDPARQIATRYHVPRIYVDVESGCFESQDEAKEALDIISGDFLPGIYTRASYWIENGWHTFDLTRWPNIDVWLAYYVESWYQNGPSDVNIDFVVHRVAAQAGLAPVTCIQYTNTIEPQPGMQCCLDARIIQEAAPGVSSLPASDPGAVVSLPSAEEGTSEVNPTTPQRFDSPPPNPSFVRDNPATAWNETENAGPEEGFTASDAPGEPDRQYAYFRHNDVPVMRFGGSETDENGRSLYPGRVAFLRAAINPPTDENPSGDGYLWLRTAPDGAVYLSRDEGD
jgi:hypothetical protein